MKSDCLTKDPSVASARTRDSVSCFVTFDGCGVVCVSSDSMLTVFFGCLQSFVTDCVMNEAPETPEVAGAIVILLLAFSLAVAALLCQLLPDDDGVTGCQA